MLLWLCFLPSSAVRCLWVARFPLCLAVWLACCFLALAALLPPPLLVAWPPGLACLWWLWSPGRWLLARPGWLWWWALLSPPWWPLALWPLLALVLVCASGARLASSLCFLWGCSCGFLSCPSWRLCARFPRSWRVLLRPRLLPGLLLGPGPRPWACPRLWLWRWLLGSWPWSRSFGLLARCAGASRCVAPGPCWPPCPALAVAPCCGLAASARCGRAAFAWFLACFVSGGALVAVSASSLRSLLWSAFRAGSLAAFGLFRSSRSPSGSVLRVAFGRWSSASAFARRWSLRCGLPVAVRRSALLGCGSVWVVSVVVLRPRAFPSGSSSLWWSARGGLRAFVLAVALWSCGVV